MRDVFLKSFSYSFHPIFIPSYTLSLYYVITPRFIAPSDMLFNFFAVWILSGILPILMFLPLKSLKKVSSIQLKSTKERILPLLIQIFILGFIAHFICDDFQHKELEIFFWGSALSALVAFILAFKSIKASLHLIGISAPVMFFIILSISFEINIIKALCIGILIMALTASSRLHMKAHNIKEITIGIIVGATPQLLLVSFYNM